MSSSKSSNVECVGKQDWTSEYNHIDCTRYYRELMDKGQIVERCEIVAKYTERCLLPLFQKWAIDLEKPLKFLDVLCCYGNDTLAYTNAYYQEDYAKTWASEETCYQIIKPRQFPVKTLGIDISVPALEFGKKAGIYDEIKTLDLNNLPDMDINFLEENCKRANILIMNSLNYIKEDQIHRIIDWFSGGKEPGMIAVGFIYPYDIPERISRYKEHLLEKLKFFGSVSMMNRYLREAEALSFGPEFGTWRRVYYEIWYLTRNE